MQPADYPTENTVDMIPSDGFRHRTATIGEVDDSRKAETNLIVTSAHYKRIGESIVEVRASGNLADRNKQAGRGGLDVSVHFDIDTAEHVVPRVGTGLRVTLTW